MNAPATPSVDDLALREQLREQTNDQLFLDMATMQAQADRAYAESLGGNVDHRILPADRAPFLDPEYAAYDDEVTRRVMNLDPAWLNPGAVAGLSDAQLQTVMRDLLAARDEQDPEGTGRELRPLAPEYALFEAEAQARGLVPHGALIGPPPADAERNYPPPAPSPAARAMSDASVAYIKPMRPTLQRTNKLQGFLDGWKAAADYYENQHQLPF